MEGLAVIFFPVLLMFFALSMERVEAQLRRLTVEEEDVEDFFEQANPEEVDTFVREGFPRAIDVLRLRRCSNRNRASRRRSNPAQSVQRSA